jgi:hypothetical protein
MVEGMGGAPFHFRFRYYSNPDFPRPCDPEGRDHDRLGHAVWVSLNESVSIIRRLEEHDPTVQIRGHPPGTLHETPLNFEIDCNVVLSFRKFFCLKLFLRLKTFF